MYSYTYTFTQTYIQVVGTRVDPEKTIFTHKADTIHTYAHIYRWMAPESIQTRKYSHKSDVYAFGILMWEMWSNGAYPYMLISEDEKVASR